MAEKERSGIVTAAWIGGAFALAGTLATGFFTLAGSHGSTPPQPPVTTSAAPPVSPSAASPVSTVSLVTSQTPAPASATPAVTGAALSGVPRQVTDAQQLTLHGTGFPKGGAVRVTFATYPGEDYQLSSAQADAQGSLTVTISPVLLSTVCGYDGHLNTWDDSGDGRQLTSDPLTVTC